MRKFCNLTFFIIFVALFVAGIFEAISNFNSNLPYSALAIGLVVMGLVGLVETVRDHLESCDKQHPNNPIRKK